MSTQARPATLRGTAGRRTSSRRSGRILQKLKPERVQLEMRSMLGWRLAADGNGLIRTRKFSQAGEAARFAAGVAEMASSHGRPALLGVTPYEVTLTLQRPSRNGIDMALIDLARQIG